jgi:hypothetical protein
MREEGRGKREKKGLKVRKYSMAWNAPQGGKTPQKKKANRGVRPLVLACAALVAVAVVGIIVWLVMVGESPTQNAEPTKVKKAAAIKTVAPDLEPIKRVVKEEPPSIRTNRWGEVVKRQKPETYVDERGILRYKKGNGRVPNPDDFKNPTRISTRGNMHEFKHPVENEIAALIMAQPGEPLVGEPDYDALKRDFVNALIDKIEIDEEDSELDKELKQNVEDLKKDLAERVKNGEDMAEIFREARRELQQSAQFKQNIDDLVLEQLYNPEISDEDLTTTFEAANKMLESKGIEPMSEKRMLRARSRMLRAQERRNAVAEAANSAN